MSEAQIETCRARIDLREDVVGAWAHLDWDFVDRQMTALAKVPEVARGPLHGVPVGVKDIFDTADLPTAYGADLYAGHQPKWDAACVTRLRQAGAVILGKTVTTEFAYWKPGKTRNPLNPDHTPGGSSQGTAAAVADGMVPLAIGSQTAASTIRPASYCGVVGFKPTRGRISLAGAKALCNSLDTVGAFAKTVKQAALLAGVMMNADLSVEAAPPQAGLFRAPDWAVIEDDAMAAVHDAATQAEAAGASVHKGDVPAAFAPLHDLQAAVMAWEAARELAHERRVIGEDNLDPHLRNLFAQADEMTAADYEAGLLARDGCLKDLDALFAGADILIGPSTLSTSPKIEDGTGDPAPCRAWTLLGLPCITLPWGNGENGLPLGLQLAARPGRDRELISAALWFENLKGGA